ncbi:FKBP-type peptidyl-prolyl cis-trans isomerase [Galbibacter orientalis]|uniref:Peptidyl-prolyl cis-trans isomerase n=1 Tax=Galbibacter orientalis DSM 19592 TaxID=926559 RepID=I3C9I5_9FLAO|nr:peptidylprolyl isomerase [Galbibacter orientalis]EIJ40278.1 FKBP-type peptidyl-prolyl cis-trans isomerase [Galbibacter orientalis DSM 19592]
MSQVKENDTVKVHYTGKLVDGQVFDSSLEREPLEFKLGEGQLIPGFENGILNMAVNEKKTINIPSSEAYGEVRQELLQEIPKNELPEDIKPEVGMGLVSRTPEGREIQLVVADVKDESIVVDANHPLAGKDLIFEIEVLEIK